jgi:hypothetical protein
LLSPDATVPRHRLHADECRGETTVRFATWNEVTGLTGAT